MKNILCKLFGHQPPVYAQTGWYSPGQEYMKIRKGAIDAIGREHADIVSECPRCKEIFKIGRIHLPERYAETKLIKENKKLRELMYIGSEI